jgi:hypothetical protein
LSRNGSILSFLDIFPCVPWRCFTVQSFASRRRRPRQLEANAPIRIACQHKFVTDLSRLF